MRERRESNQPKSSVVICRKSFVNKLRQDHPVFDLAASRDSWSDTNCVGSFSTYFANSSGSSLVGLLTRTVRSPKSTSRRTSPTTPARHPDARAGGSPVESSI